MRVAFYVRVSTAEQTTENQEIELRRVAEARGWTVVKVYRDAGISGAKGRDKRPAFDALWKAATRREFDMIASWAIDRLGRSLADVALFMRDCEALGVGLYLHQQALDTTTPAGRAMLQMAGVFAEMERALIRERTIAGQARARGAGVRFGRPTVAADKEAAVRASLAAGVGIVKTAKMHGVGVSVVQRLKSEARSPRDRRHRRTEGG
jgi:DNA invertase Pin-like site-specific DNA recombinase